jgi:hypothetical protein
LDLSNYAKSSGIDTSRQYGLGNFNITENIATNDEISKLKYPQGVFSVYYKKIRTKLHLFNISFVPRMIKKKGDIYLDGYWQTEKYFVDFAEQIRKDLTLKNPFSNDAKAFSDQIKSTKPSVSMHMRRGDYANDKNTNRYWGTCNNEYYFKALNYLVSKVGANMHVFVFSDDIEWVKKNISIAYPTTYVSSPDIADYEEMSLMSMCDHNIIANSSFGWWGAWLNKNPGKIVVAPKRWTTKGNFAFRDIVPASWIRFKR